MRARLAFGISMAVDFEVYLIDEVTAVGDSSLRRKFAAAFREKMDHTDIIMCSHAEDTLCQYCDEPASRSHAAPALARNRIRHSIASPIEQGAPVLGLK